MYVGVWSQYTVFRLYGLFPSLSSWAVSTWAEISHVNRKNNMSILSAFLLIGITFGILGVLAMKLSGPTGDLGAFGFVVMIIGCLLITHTSSYKAGEEGARLEIYRGEFDVEEHGQECGWKKDNNTGE